jgi:DNA-binding CsgD family transcriptional regulator
MPPTHNLIAFDFIDRAQCVQNHEELAEAFSYAIAHFGFDNFVCAHHVDFDRITTVPFGITTYPRDWLNHYRSEKMHWSDKVIDICLTQRAPFFWSEVITKSPLTKSQRRVFDEASESGLVEGLTIPMPAPGLPMGSCTVTAPKQHIDREAMRDIALMANYLYDAIRRIRLENGIVDYVPPALTPRERECLTLSAKGLTAKEIARILDIGLHTTQEYLETCRTKFGANKLIEAVARAIGSGQISI